MDNSAHGGLTRASLEATDEAFFRMTAVRDEAGRIVDFIYADCNRAALSVLGRSRNDIIGQHLLDLFPSHADNGLFDAYVAVTETGVTFRHEFAFDENGVSGEYEIVVSRFEDGYLLLGHDITSRKRDERQLALLTEQLQTALTSRVAIEQAKGFLAAKYETDTATAFTVIRRYARNHNQRIHDVAAAIVEGRLILGADENGKS